VRGEDAVGAAFHATCDLQVRASRHCLASARRRCCPISGGVPTRAAASPLSVEGGRDASSRGEESKARFNSQERSTLSRTLDGGK
jgi:hypothetical protein